MISSKKSYAEQMLQLALALSLLQVDPRDYLNQGWDSQLEMRNGDGWQLEMLRAVPISEYPYANRKAMMPLIEDLIRFDRQNVQDITTYLLNVQNAQNDHTSSSIQDHHESTMVNGGGGSGGGGGGGVVGGGAVSIEQPPNINITTNSNVNEVEVFLNSNYFEEEIPIVDQNLADLGEYGDVPLSVFPYFNLPFKDEPPEEFTLPNILIKKETPSTSSAYGDVDIKTPSTSTNTATENPDWNNASNSAQDNSSDDENRDVEKNIKIKNEIKEEEDQNNEETNETEPLLSTIELTKQESEIVEVLWKQDVDLGYSLTPPKLASKSATESTSSKSLDDEIEKLKALEEVQFDKDKNDESNNNKPELDDEWAGIPFRIDNETGEYIRQPSLQLDEILQDVLQLGDLTVDSEEESSKTEEESNKNKPENNFPIENCDQSLNSIVDGCIATIEPPQSEVEISSLPSPLFDFEDASELDVDLEMMIQSATAGPFQHHRSGQNYGATNSAFRQSGFHHHHHHHQSRVPLSRGLSMEQRLQDIANLFNPIPGMGVGMGVGEMSPYPHYPTHYSYQTASGIPQHGQFPHHTPHPVLHNSSLADIGTGQPHYGHNLGSAVSSSMHLTNSTHDTDAGASGYKTDPEMMYYSNTSSELNHTTDGFINSILNDEDLQLMDMGVNENFCGMRMLDSNTTSNNSSVLGSASGTSHSSNHLLSSTMPTSLGPLGSNSATGNEALGSTGDRLDASSDSAVSSMGSERVPSLSDGEWGDAGSDSAQDYHHGKYGGPYDYSYNSRLGDVGRHPVAQKKHQMFGKRYFQEQPPNIPVPLNHPANSAHQHTPSDHMPTPVKYEYEPYGLHHHTPSIGHNLEGAVGPLVGKDHLPLMSNATDMKYPCSLDFSVRTPRTPHDIINHNHTYTLPQGTGSTPRPQIRDKKHKKAEDEHLTRDEKRARALNIPITVNDIINLPMDEFNERLSKYDLSENQLSLIRDIRRRGKNKVAAQNCRKRKLDQILSLEDEVKEVRRRKERLYQEREAVFAERKRIANKFALLHRHVFQYLRDADGNPCSPSQYSLQQAADGSVYLLRRENKKPDGSGSSTNSNPAAAGGGNPTGPTSNNVPPNHLTHSNANGTSHHHHVSQGPPTGNHQKE